MDVILGVTEKMFTNMMLAILLGLPVDEAFKPNAWSPQEARPIEAAA